MTGTASAGTGTSHPWFRDESRPAPSSLRTASPAEVTALLREELAGLSVSLPGPWVPAQPFVLPRQSYDELFDVARTLLALVRRAVLALDGGWPGRIEALGADPADYPLLSGQDNTETAYCSMMARPDIVIGENGPQLLEFNVSGTFGGPNESHGLTAVWQRTHSERFFGHDPLLARVRAFEDVCSSRRLPRAVAIIGSLGDLEDDADIRFQEIELEQFRRRGFTADFFEPDQLPDALGRPGNLRYPLGLRNFATADWTERGQSLRPVYDAQRAGLLLLPPQSSGLLANKKALALVSEGRPWMTRAERAVADRHLPWTRITLPGRTRWEGGDHDLSQLLLGRQERFVLKKAIGMMGREVLVGRHTEPADWRLAVEAAFAAADSVVQQYVEPASCDLELTDGRAVFTAQVAPVLSPMLFGDRPGGCWARFLADEADRSASRGVISVGGAGAAENAVLTWADPADAAASTRAGEAGR
ncbi:hypothetical protein HRW23_27760 [Streptomyces lunaelactis]|uniref:hypothetical protein n=1 Tax=Streptomyces lunaelactis TaxID=1535768 RepID=UPI0015852892|nr:hypothetical protein [Streptomyces lunaelactis]NUK49165.1 hypothetical protein [Streptomyces lunaelactis]NUK62916.1 hypothetical protein [Streptomyces lunaelactis]NUK71178.1 hypothetical protein [Streptomyces lunaelactis]NUK81114.1 hypothetical protein [Streptomyces lunaelactis]